jgi:hypothetical protein
VSGKGSRSARVGYESPDSVLARVGAVEVVGFRSVKDIQADTAVGLLEEIEPHKEVVEQEAWNPANHVRRREGFVEGNVERPVT